MLIRLAASGAYGLCPGQRWKVGRAGAERETPSGETGTPVAPGRWRRGLWNWMHYLTGYTGDRRFVAEIQRLGWGRMLCERIGPPYDGERMGVDNGAFGAWNNGLEWDGREYLAQMERVAILLPTAPYLAVTPDKVADPDSLRFSLTWLDRVAVRWDWPWYLAVQDGMTPADVAPVLPRFAGLFLGGTKRWKRDTARQWGRLAAEHGKCSHYARCSTVEDLNHARRCGYDSADSTFLLWTRERFAAFVRDFEGVRPQEVLAL